jgi:hypothetical protein
MIVSLLLLVALVVAGWSSVSAQIREKIMEKPQTYDVTVKRLSRVPVIDGDGTDWSDVPLHIITVSPAQADDPLNHLGTVDVILKAGHHRGIIYFLVRWPDPDESRSHNTWIWDKARKRYGAGEEKEDGLAFKFDMGGDFDYCMLTGKEYKADVWTWRAARTDPAALAEDGMHVFSRRAIPRAGAKRILNGPGEIWIRRTTDKGSRLYTIVFPLDYAGDQLPRYTIQPDPFGSTADVRAKGRWQGGFWTVELTRKFVTGNDDDVRFELTTPVRAAIAVFDKAEAYHHSTSGRITFRFER